MSNELYELSVKSDAMTFEFTSIGPKGEIPKLVIYSKMPTKNLYNLAFGDKNLETDTIDDLVITKLQSLNLPPSPLADDATFLRRSFLDTIGVPPTPDEVERFLADHSEFAREPAPDTDPALCSPTGDLTLLPQVHGTDGAYAARLRRRA